MPARARVGHHRRRLDQTLRRASRAATPRDGPQTSRVGNAAAGFAATRTRAPGDARLASRLVRVCVRACERAKDDDLKGIKFKNLPVVRPSVGVGVDGVRRRAAPRCDASSAVWRSPARGRCASVGARSVRVDECRVRALRAVAHHYLARRRSRIARIACRATTVRTAR